VVVETYKDDSYLENQKKMEEEIKLTSTFSGA